MTTENTSAAAGTPNADAVAAAAAAGTPDANAAADAAAAAAAATAAGGADAATKAAADAKAAPDAKAAADAAAAAAAAAQPVKYELTLPDGGFVEQSDLAAIAELAKAKGWTNDQAQAALTEHADALKAQSDRFLSDLTTHKEIGGDNLAAAQQRANAVIDKFLPADTPEGQVLRAGLKKSGYGNYAPFVLLLARIGKSMSEDRPIDAGGAQRGTTAKRDAAAVLYGSGS